jgi:hypothetical protein
VIRRIRRRRIESGSSVKPSELYSAVATMKEFNLAPDQWRALSRRDKKILQYFQIVAEYHLDLYREKLKQEGGQQNLVAGMPKQLR